MLVSTVINLRAQRAGQLPLAMGEYGHAAFLSIIREVAPDLAQVLHDRDERKPFTVSPLLGRLQRRNRSVRVEREQHCWMRFTLLDPTLYTVFTRYFAEATTFTLKIKLGDIPFVVEDIIATQDGHGWSGYANFSDLLSEAECAEEIPLRFYSLTAFSLGDTENGTARFALLPTPELVFESLCQQWNQFSDDEAFDVDLLRQFVADQVIVKRHQVSSDLWHFRKYPQAGFTGYCVYGVVGEHSAEVRHLNALADFAFYAGIGYKTTMGMGQCRRMRDRRDR